jgi:lysophospholipase L1-like esterase
MYGTNDAFIDNYTDESNHLPRIPLQNYKKNLHAIVRILRSNSINPILMTSIPMGKFKDSDIGFYKKNGINSILKEYVEAVRQISALENVPLVDHFKEWQKWKKKGKNIDFWMTDGIHPNPKGHRLIASTIYKVLKPILDK